MSKVASKSKDSTSAPASGESQLSEKATDLQGRRILEIVPTGDGEPVFCPPLSDDAEEARLRKRERWFAGERLLPDFAVPKEWRPIPVDVETLECLMEVAWAAVDSGELTHTSLINELFRLEADVLCVERDRLHALALNCGWDEEEVGENNPGGIRLQRHRVGRTKALRMIPEPDRCGLADYQIRDAENFARFNELENKRLNEMEDDQDGERRSAKAGAQ